MERTGVMEFKRSEDNGLWDTRQPSSTYVSRLCQPVTSAGRVLVFYNKYV